MIKKKFLLPFIVSALFIFSCAHTGTGYDPDFFSELQKGYKPISFDTVSDENAPPTARFDSYYGLRTNGLYRDFGYIDAAGYKIAVHYFAPERSKGTAVLIHGYHCHSGLEKNLINRLTEENISVVAFDLPGHGLSDGAPATIDDFGKYTKVLAAVDRALKAETPPPYYLIGHSTGSSVIIDKALNGELHGYSAVILAAPLVRSQLWGLSSFGRALISPFSQEVPRVYRDDTSNLDYLEFVRTKDPFQHMGIPLEWFDSLSKWNIRISEAPQSSVKMTVLQGTLDVVVDYEYNLTFLSEKFPNTEILIFENANHEIFNEAEPIREEVFSALLSRLR